MASLPAFAADSARRYLKGLGLGVDSLCLRYFDAHASWLVYAYPCSPVAPGHARLDGDVLLQADRRRWHVTRALGNPGGIDILEPPGAR